MAGCIVAPHSAAMASVEISHLCRSSITRSIYDIGVIVQMQSRPIRIGGLHSIVQSSSMFRHLYWYTEPSNLFLMHPFLQRLARSTRFGSTIEQLERSKRFHSS